MDEVLPGVLHWTTFHAGIGEPVHSHFFVMGDDPAAVRAGLSAALERLLEVEFDAMLFAHGAPIASGAKARLSAFVAAQRAG